MSKTLINNSSDSEALLTESTTDTEEPESNNMVKVSTRAVLSFFITALVQGFKRFWALCTTCLLILLLLYWLYGGLVTLTLLLVALLGLLYNVQDKLLYYPDQPPTARIFVESPAVLGLSHENIFVRASDGTRINLVFIKTTSVISQAPTVIYFHGNAGNVGHRLLNAYSLCNTCGCNVLLVEYRGYGKSSGTPSEAGLYKDATAAMEFLLRRKDVDKNKIVVFGRSLGGAVAVHLASCPTYANKVSCLLLENTFTSLPDIGRHIFDIKFIHYLPLWCHKNKYPSKELIRKVHVPTLFLSGLADTLIPPKMMQDLYNCSGSGLKRFARFEAGTHNETWQCSGYYESINRFLQEVTESRSQDSYLREGAYSVQVPFDDGASAAAFNV